MTEMGLASLMRSDLAPLPEYDLTELGNARRMVDAYGEGLRHVDGLGWLAYDGRRWCTSSDGQAIRRSKAVARAIKKEAMALMAAAQTADSPVGDRPIGPEAAALTVDDVLEAHETLEAREIKLPDLRDFLAHADERLRAMAKAEAGSAEAAERDRLMRAVELLKWALRSQSRSVITATVALARTESEIDTRPDALDRDPWALNVLNGTLDLRTGELRPHRTDDLITKLAPVVYDPDARSDLWQRFLEDTTGGDDDLGAFLQRAAGYSLTGDTGEEVVLFVHGPTGSGKSTFMSAVKSAVGDYSVTADFETFIARRFGGGIRNDIARLAGARLVTSIEVDEGKQLAAALVKELTGGDDVTARFLYKEHSTFKPQFKLWLVANHKPQVRDDDDAIWRRIRVIPFEHTVPVEKRDPSVKSRLTDMSRSGSAILAWLVEGCLRWQREGLGKAKAVEEATHRYQVEMDISSGFWEEATVLEETALTSSQDIRTAYRSWCDRNDVPRHLRLDDKRLAGRLRTMGCVEHRTREQRGWRGIRVIGDTT